MKPGDPQKPPVDLRRAFDPKLVKIWRVKPDVGNVKNDRQDLIEPIEPDQPSEPDGPPCCSSASVGLFHLIRSRYAQRADESNARALP